MVHQMPPSPFQVGSNICHSPTVGFRCRFKSFERTEIKVKVNYFVSRRQFLGSRLVKL